MNNKPPRRVLLIDDNDMTRTLLRGILKNADYEIVGEAGNGEQGLEMALRLRVDAVCLDVKMPKADGLAVLKQIKERMPRTAVVMVTGSSDRDTVQAAIADGADGYVVKPFNSARVLDAMDAALDRSGALKTA